MLGQKLGEEKGVVTGRRVLSVDGNPAIEVSFAAEGTLLGVKQKSLGTYVSEVRPDGTIRGEGQGVTMGVGGEMATWKGGGVGTFDGKGGASFRGAVYMQTSASAWTSLNTVAMLFEFSESADGKTHGEFWEWK